MSEFVFDAFAATLSLKSYPTAGELLTYIKQTNIGYVKLTEDPLLL
jgi:hypothetical protein